MEFKWHRVRVITYVSGGRLRLVCRNGDDMTDSYPELRVLARSPPRTALHAHGAQWVQPRLVGVVAFTEWGRPPRPAPPPAGAGRAAIRALTTYARGAETNPLECRRPARRLLRRTG